MWCGTTGTMVRRRVTRGVCEFNSLFSLVRVRRQYLSLGSGALSIVFCFHHWCRYSLKHIKFFRADS